MKAAIRKAEMPQGDPLWASLARATDGHWTAPTAPRVTDITRALINSGAALLACHPPPRLVAQVPQS
jgi:hypothetical protein